MKRFLWLMLVSVVLLLASCTQKELCYDHPHLCNLRVEFDWRDAPNANPEKMIVYFYPLDSRLAPIRSYEFVGGRGGSISIMQGKYRVLTYNNDTEGVQFRYIHDFELHEAYTREGSVFESIYGNATRYAPVIKGAEGQRTVINPDMMWSCATLDVEITDEGISYLPVPGSRHSADRIAALTRGSAITDEHTLTLYPHQTVCEYSYEIRNVTNLQHVTQLCCALTAMAPSYTIGNDELSAEPVTIPAPATSDQQSTVRGEFLTFGHDPWQPDRQHYLILYVWLADGSKFFYRNDVTDQVNNAPNPKRVHLVVDGLDLHLPLANGSGFDPSVDGWESENQEIPM